ncbi:aminotransferase class I/II-fold pyridoxal phosphate-dependent enzyme [Limnofasciculus baicalensis]|uniref:Aminotransferase class I/II-fold pyridoxal phosphate-dependent enzyme n=1 Tax=Limnofasciculus baicalensis BBK-W-15 TaxID=2699891 RepID=A0AAE3GTM0_9CYAN|nr:aminotransferase class I/II-fold pyridoxal phosphate-dependent enzyme [Limnofasciculus baicalensis]MCP2730505.1 aminotransferase class I/II-fold pyridoxal phosphate-dependent enzyme [Limnofasciculus baicalensis BBK-W-15]
MNDKLSTYKMIASYYPDVKVRLHTPAHQGVGRESEYFSDRIYAYDLPFFNRNEFYDIEKSIAELYKTNHTFFLTGGATQGILVACTLLGRKHRKVAIGLNSHLSVIHGFIMAGLDPLFIPSFSLMPTAAEVIQALETAGSEVTALLLTYPSYDGIITDLSSISKYCREKNIEFIIDEAHGTHFPFLEEETLSALAQESDLVIHSLHKFVGSLVQTALVHLPKTSKITEDEVITALSVFETTSRSNLLLLSIEEAIHLAFGNERKSLFHKAAQKCQELRYLLDNFGNVLTYDAEVRDPLKLFLYSDRATGEEIAALLLERGVDCEYSNKKGVLSIFSFQNTDDDFAHVATVLEQVYKTLDDRETGQFFDERILARTPVMRCLPREAFFASTRKKVSLEEAKGMVSCNSIKKIPPCVPVLIPGEEITDWHLERIMPDTLVEVMT